MGGLVVLGDLDALLNVAQLNAGGLDVSVARVRRYTVNRGRWSVRSRRWSVSGRQRARVAAAVRSRVLVLQQRLLHLVQQAVVHVQSLGRLMTWANRDVAAIVVSTATTTTMTVTMAVSTMNRRFSTHERCTNEHENLKRQGKHNAFISGPLQTIDTEVESRIAVIAQKVQPLHNLP